MKKIVVICVLLLLATNSYACGDTTVYRAMDVAGYASVGLLLLTVVILPFSVLLVSKAAGFSQLVFLASVVLFGLSASIVLLVVDSHPYMIPGSIVLAATSLFAPYLYLLVQSLKIYRNRSHLKISESR